MKHPVTYVVAILGLILGVSGCVIQSLHPAYTSEAVVQKEEFDGVWKQLSTKNREQSQPVWQFHRHEITALHDEQMVGKFKITYFLVDGQLFADTTASPDINIEDIGLSAEWMLHMLPIHMIFKVEHHEQTLTFLPLNEKWIKEAFKKQLLPLPTVTLENDQLLITATPDEWMAFLEEHKATQALYDVEHALKFTR